LPRRVDFLACKSGLRPRRMPCFGLGLGVSISDQPYKHKVKGQVENKG
jgi:hypothetical protein